MNVVATLAVRPSRQFPFLARHPWVHQGSLIENTADLPCGAVVDITTHDGHWIARGLYNPNSQLRVRLYSWDQQQELNDAFVRRRLDEAIQRRTLCGAIGDNEAYRLVYSEADGLSGLIIDRYAKAMVIQLTAAVMETWLDTIRDYLVEQFAPDAIILRMDPKLKDVERIQHENGIIHGGLPELGSLVYRQNDLMLEVDLLQGQKTGSYLDQRDNHVAAARYLSGRSVLDMCCHTGGFGLVAAARGARSVLGIDGSESVLETARHNSDRNQLSNITFESGDCFDTLAEMVKEGRRFDAVILDPPRLASSRKHIESATRAYYRLNRSALDLIENGGILVTCSCSGRVSRSDFLNVLVDAGRRARRDLTVLENRTAPADHPMRISCPESDYLKCLICQVTD